MARCSKLAGLLAAALAGGGCKGADPALGPPEWVHPLLSQWGLFDGAIAAQKPAAGVWPYEVNSILYADGAGKGRWLALPPGQKIGFDPVARWTFPEGTIVAKSFDYPKDARVPDGPRTILETRLLILHQGAWTSHTYVWNDAQTDAAWFVAGESLAVDRIDETGAMVHGEYRVPSTAQCKTCHGQSGQLTPLGPRTRQMNRAHDYGAGPENQIAHLARAGLFATAPGDPATLEALADPHGNAAVAPRARAYLEANCAHCHNENGYASSTALRLELETTSSVDLGVCRHPVAAGHAAGSFLYDVVPGHPEQSIVVYRMQSNDPEIKMPQLPLTTSDRFGVDLVSQWIQGLGDPPCP